MGQSESVKEQKQQDRQMIHNLQRAELKRLRFMVYIQNFTLEIIDNKLYCFDGLNWQLVSDRGFTDEETALLYCHQISKSEKEKENQEKFKQLFKPAYFDNDGTINF